MPVQAGLVFRERDLAANQMGDVYKLLGRFSLRLEVQPPDRGYVYVCPKVGVLSKLAFSIWG